jgi:hypothetical protein
LGEYSHISWKSAHALNDTEMLSLVEFLQAEHGEQFASMLPELLRLASASSACPRSVQRCDSAPLFLRVCLLSLAAPVQKSFRA